MTQLAADSLLWIKSELDSTLVRARQALEAYVEDSADTAQLEDCLAHLHQVQGTLRIVEVHGAALLAAEMESLAQELRDGEVAGNDEAYEVLMRAMLQLPDYLERVIGGQRDVPLALLSLLNDLRSVRGQPLLSESSLFAQNLASRGASADRLSISGAGDIIALAKKLRPKFQSALLGWFKTGKDDSLRTLADVSGQLEQAATSPNVFQLWWIVGGVLEALIDGGLDATVGLKQLLGQVDRQIKRLLDGGEQAVEADPPSELVNNLLYYVGKASSTGERVRGIKESFRLTELLPEEDQLTALREGMAGPNAELMRTVGVALKEDLTQVKDTLDVYVRTGKQDSAGLEPMVELLGKVGNTLRALELDKLRSRVEGQREALSEMVHGSQAIDEAKLLEMAAALIEVEMSLDSQLERAVRDNQQSAAAEGAGDEGGDDFSDVSRAVIRESIINLARIKDAIVEYVKNPAEREILRPVPTLTHQIKAGMSLLDEARAMALLDSIQAYIEKRVFGQEALPPQTELDRMADAIVSVEYYLETLQQGRGDPIAILDNAETCVSALGFPVGSEAAAPTPETAVEPEAPAETPPAETPTSEDLELTLETPEGTGETLEIPEPPAEPEAEAEPEPQAAAPEPPAQAPAAPAEPPASKPAVSARPDEVDPEIVEIFLEESQEELASLREYFPRWRANPEQTEALSTVRRSFHTLKGSGRMVGAELIGEFAWAFENMLNRVIDQTVEPTEDMFQLIEQALDALPQLIEQLEVGTEPQVDVEHMMTLAHAISRGEQPSVQEAAPAAAEPATPETPDEAVTEAPAVEETPPTEEAGEEITLEGGDLENADDQDAASLPDHLEWNADAPLPEPEAGESAPEPRAEEEAPVMDPVLYDVFNREAQGHLLVLEEFVAGGPGMPDEELARAMHTLHGSAGMAGVSQVQTVAQALEHYIKRARDAEAEISAEDLSLLGEGAGIIREVVEALPDNEAEGIDLDDFTRRVADAEGALPERRVTTEDDADAAEEPAAEERSVAEPEPEAPVETAAEAEPEPEPEIEPETEEAEPAPQAPAAAKETAAARGIQPQHVPLDALTGFDAELAEIFLEEANDLLEAIDTNLGEWASHRGDAGPVVELQRHLHTLKGGARMAGITPMGDLAHEMETVFAKVVDGHVSVSEELVAVTQRAVDRLHRMLEQVYAREPIVDGRDLLFDLAQLTGRKVKWDFTEAEAPAAESAEPAAESTEDQEYETTPADTQAYEQEHGGASSEEYEADDRSAREAFEERRTQSRIQQEVVRVRSDLIEELLNNAGEVSIYRSRLDQQVSNINFHLNEFDNTVVRLRDQLRKLEIETEAQILYQYEQETGDEAHQDFDPLELDRYSNLQQLSRALAESMSDLVSLQNLLTQQAREAETLLLQQSRVNTSLQDGLMRTRMVPFSRHARRLRRIVRQTADETGKKAELQLAGAEGEMDRQILERVLGPLEHMMRNAVIHGIETPEVRRANGKPEAGTVKIELHRESSEVVMVITDDGAGLNVAAIRKKAESLGMLRPGANLPDSDVMQFVLETGFSTAETLTQAAGRGVGMDVVNSEIKQLGGSLSIASEPGRGAEFTIRLPFTLAITQALMVNVAEEQYAIPLPTIEGIVRIPRTELMRLMQEEHPVFGYGGRDYALQYLGALLGMGVPQLPEELDTIPVLLVRAGEHSSAVVTEGMLGSREVVVKSVGPQITNIRGISGATLLGDGSILLILDPGALVRAAAAAAAQGEALSVGEREAKQEDTRPLVMVVDDSITVRRVTQRLLERYGLRVVTAKDGVDALSMLQEHTPDAMLLDIEMPRMDGYELATHMRNDERFKQIPIIMITSRTGEKHRNRAMEIGVDRYLGKPYQEDELLENIAALVDGFNPERTRWE